MGHVLQEVTRTGFIFSSLGALPSLTEAGNCLSFFRKHCRL